MLHISMPPGPLLNFFILCSLNILVIINCSYHKEDPAVRKRSVINSAHWNNQPINLSLSFYWYPQLELVPDKVEETFEVAGVGFLQARCFSCCPATSVKALKTKIRNIKRFLEPVTVTVIFVSNLYSFFHINSKKKKKKISV